MLSFYGSVIAKNIISSAMNTVILIVHFPFFKYNRSILVFIFDIIPLYNCPFLSLMHLFILELIIMVALCNRADHYIFAV